MEWEKTRVSPFALLSVAVGVFQERKMFFIIMFVIMY
jgi:hypothetical protein